jgi:hypothetical protein
MCTKLFQGYFSKMFDIRDLDIKGKNCFSCAKYFDSCSLGSPVSGYLQSCRYVYTRPIMDLELFHSSEQILLEAHNVAYWPCRRRHVHYRRESSGDMFCLECRKCSIDPSLSCPVLANYTLTSLLYIFPWCGRDAGVRAIDSYTIQ